MIFWISYIRRLFWFFIFKVIKVARTMDVGETGVVASGGSFVGASYYNSILRISRFLKSNSSTVAYQSIYSSQFFKSANSNKFKKLFNVSFVPSQRLDLFSPLDDSKNAKTARAFRFNFSEFLGSGSEHSEITREFSPLIGEKYGSEFSFQNSADFETYFFLAFTKSTYVEVIPHMSSLPITYLENQSLMFNPYVPQSNFSFYIDPRVYVSYLTVVGDDNGLVTSFFFDLDTWGSFSFFGYPEIGLRDVLHGSNFNVSPSEALIASELAFSNFSFLQDLFFSEVLFKVVSFQSFLPFSVYAELFSDFGAGDHRFFNSFFVEFFQDPVVYWKHGSFFHDTLFSPGVYYPYDENFLFTMHPFISYSFEFETIGFLNAVGHGLQLGPSESLFLPFYFDFVASNLDMDSLDEEIFLEKNLVLPKAPAAYSDNLFFDYFRPLSEKVGVSDCSISPSSDTTFFFDAQPPSSGPFDLDLVDKFFSQKLVFDPSYLYGSSFFDSFSFQWEMLFLDYDRFIFSSDIHSDFMDSFYNLEFFDSSFYKNRHLDFALYTPYDVEDLDEDEWSFSDVVELTDGTLDVDGLEGYYDILIDDEWPFYEELNIIMPSSMESSFDEIVFQTNFDQYILPGAFSSNVVSGLVFSEFSSLFRNNIPDGEPIGDLDFDVSQLTDPRKIKVFRLDKEKFKSNRSTRPGSEPNVMGMDPDEDRDFRTFRMTSQYSAYARLRKLPFFLVDPYASQQSFYADSESVYYLDYITYTDSVLLNGDNLEDYEYSLFDESKYPEYENYIYKYLMFEVQYPDPFTDTWVVPTNPAFSKVSVSEVFSTFKDPTFFDAQQYEVFIYSNFNFSANAYEILVLDPLLTFDRYSSPDLYLDSIDSDLFDSRILTYGAFNNEALIFDFESDPLTLDNESDFFIRIPDSDDADDVFEEWYDPEYRVATSLRFRISKDFTEYDDFFSAEVAWPQSEADSIEFMSSNYFTNEFLYSGFFTEFGYASIDDEVSAVVGDSGFGVKAFFNPYVFDPFVGLGSGVIIDEDVDIAPSQLTYYGDLLRFSVISGFKPHTPKHFVIYGEDAESIDPEVSSSLYSFDSMEFELSYDSSSLKSRAFAGFGKMIFSQNSKRAYVKEDDYASVFLTSPYYWNAMDTEYSSFDDSSELSDLDYFDTSSFFYSYPALLDSFSIFSDFEKPLVGRDDGEADYTFSFDGSYTSGLAFGTLLDLGFVRNNATILGRGWYDFLQDYEFDTTPELSFWYESGYNGVHYLLNTPAMPQDYELMIFELADFAAEWGVHLDFDSYEFNDGSSIVSSSPHKYDWYPLFDSSNSSSNWFFKFNDFVLSKSFVDAYVEDISGRAYEGQPIMNDHESFVDYSDPRVRFIDPVFDSGVFGRLHNFFVNYSRSNLVWEQVYFSFEFFIFDVFFSNYLFSFSSSIKSAMDAVQVNFLIEDYIPAKMVMYSFHYFQFKLVFDEFIARRSYYYAVKLLYGRALSSVSTNFFAFLFYYWIYFVEFLPQLLIFFRVHVYHKFDDFSSYRNASVYYEKEILSFFKNSTHPSCKFGPRIASRFDNSLFVWDYSYAFFKLNYPELFSSMSRLEFISFYLNFIESSSSSGVNVADFFKKSAMNSFSNLYNSTYAFNKLVFASNQRGLDFVGHMAPVDSASEAGFDETLPSSKEVASIFNLSFFYQSVLVFVTRRYYLNFIWFYFITRLLGFKSRLGFFFFKKNPTQGLFKRELNNRDLVSYVLVSKSNLVDGSVSILSRNHPVRFSIDLGRNLTDFKFDPTSSLEPRVRRSLNLVDFRYFTSIYPKRYALSKTSSISKPFTVFRKPSFFVSDFSGFGMGFPAQTTAYTSFRKSLTKKIFYRYTKEIYRFESAQQLYWFEIYDDTSKMDFADEFEIPLGLYTDGFKAVRSLQRFTNPFFFKKYVKAHQPDFSVIGLPCINNFGFFRSPSNFFNHSIGGSSNKLLTLRRLSALRVSGLFSNSTLMLNNYYSWAYYADVFHKKGSIPTFIYLKLYWSIFYFTAPSGLDLFKYSLKDVSHLNQFSSFFRAENLRSQFFDDYVIGRSSGVSDFRSASPTFHNFVTSDQRRPSATTGSNFLRNPIYDTELLEYSAFPQLPTSHSFGNQLATFSRLGQLDSLRFDRFKMLMKKLFHKHFKPVFETYFRRDFNLEFGSESTTFDKLSGFTGDLASEFDRGQLEDRWEAVRERTEKNPKRNIKNIRRKFRGRDSVRNLNAFIRLSFPYQESVRVESKFDLLGATNFGYWDFLNYLIGLFSDNFNFTGSSRFHVPRSAPKRVKDWIFPFKSPGLYPVRPLRSVKYKDRFSRNASDNEHMYFSDFFLNLDNETSRDQTVEFDGLVFETYLSDYKARDRIEFPNLVKYANYVKANRPKYFSWRLTSHTKYFVHWKPRRSNMLRLYSRFRKVFSRLPRTNVQFAPFSSVYPLRRRARAFRSRYYNKPTLRRRYRSFFYSSYSDQWFKRDEMSRNLSSTFEMDPEYMNISYYSRLDSQRGVEDQFMPFLAMEYPWYQPKSHADELKRIGKSLNTGALRDKSSAYFFRSQFMSEYNARPFLSESSFSAHKAAESAVSHRSYLTQFFEPNNFLGFYTRYPWFSKHNVMKFKSQLVDEEDQKDLVIRRHFYPNKILKANKKKGRGHFLRNKAKRRRRSSRRFALYMRNFAYIKLWPSIFRSFYRLSFFPTSTVGFSNFSFKNFFLTFFVDHNEFIFNFLFFFYKMAYASFYFSFYFFYSVFVQLTLLHHIIMHQLMRVAFLVSEVYIGQLARRASPNSFKGALEVLFFHNLLLDFMKAWVQPIRLFNQFFLLIGPLTWVAKFFTQFKYNFDWFASLRFLRFTFLFVFDIFYRTLYSTVIFSSLQLPRNNRLKLFFYSNFIKFKLFIHFFLRAQFYFYIPLFFLAALLRFTTYVVKFFFFVFFFLLNFIFVFFFSLLGRFRVFASVLFFVKMLVNFCVFAFRYVMIKFALVPFFFFRFIIIHDELQTFGFFFRLYDRFGVFKIWLEKLFAYRQFLSRDIHGFSSYVGYRFIVASVLFFIRFFRFTVFMEILPLVFFVIFVYSVTKVLYEPFVVYSFFNFFDLDTMFFFVVPQLLFFALGLLVVKRAYALFRGAYISAASLLVSLNFYMYFFGFFEPFSKNFISDFTNAHMIDTYSLWSRRLVNVLGNPMKTGNRFRSYHSSWKLRLRRDPESFYNSVVSGLTFTYEPITNKVKFDFPNNHFKYYGRPDEDFYFSDIKYRRTKMAYAPYPVFFSLNERINYKNFIFGLNNSYWVYFNPEVGSLRQTQLRLTRRYFITGSATVDVEPWYIPSRKISQLLFYETDNRVFFPNYLFRKHMFAAMFSSAYSGTTILPASYSHTVSEDQLTFEIHKLFSLRAYDESEMSNKGEMRLYYDWDEWHRPHFGNSSISFWKETRLRRRIFRRARVINHLLFDFFYNLQFRFDAFTVFFLKFNVLFIYFGFFFLFCFIFAFFFNVFLYFACFPLTFFRRICNPPKKSKFISSSFFIYFVFFIFFYLVANFVVFFSDFVFVEWFFLYFYPFFVTVQTCVYAFDLREFFFLYFLFFSVSADPLLFSSFSTLHLPLKSLNFTHYDPWIRFSGLKAFYGLDRFYMPFTLHSSNRRFPVAHYIVGFDNRSSVYHDSSLVDINYFGTPSFGKGYYAFDGAGAYYYHPFIYQRVQQRRVYFTHSDEARMNGGLPLDFYFIREGKNRFYHKSSVFDRSLNWLLEDLDSKLPVLGTIFVGFRSYQNDYFWSLNDPKTLEAILSKFRELELDFSLDTPKLVSVITYYPLDRPLTSVDKIAESIVFPKTKGFTAFGSGLNFLKSLPKEVWFRQLGTFNKFGYSHFYPGYLYSYAPSYFFPLKDELYLNFYTVFQQYKLLFALQLGRIEYVNNVTRNVRFMNSLSINDARFVRRKHNRYVLLARRSPALRFGGMLYTYYANYLQSPYSQCSTLMTINRELSLGPERSHKLLNRLHLDQIFTTSKSRTFGFINRGRWDHNSFFYKNYDPIYKSLQRSESIFFISSRGNYLKSIVAFVELINKSNRLSELSVDQVFIQPAYRIFFYKFLSSNHLLIYNTELFVNWSVYRFLYKNAFFSQTTSFILPFTKYSDLITGLNQLSSFDETLSVYIRAGYLQDPSRAHYGRRYVDVVSQLVMTNVLDHKYNMSIALSNLFKNRFTLLSKNKFYPGSGYYVQSLQNSPFVRPSFLFRDFTVEAYNLHIFNLFYKYSFMVFGPSKVFREYFDSISSRLFASAYVDPYYVYIRGRIRPSATTSGALNTQYFNRVHFSNRFQLSPFRPFDYSTYPGLRFHFAFYNSSRSHSFAFFVDPFLVFFSQLGFTDHVHGSTALSPAPDVFFLTAHRRFSILKGVARKKWGYELPHFRTYLYSKFKPFRLIDLSSSLPYKYYQSRIRMNYVQRYVRPRGRHYPSYYGYSFVGHLRVAPNFFIRLHNSFSSGFFAGVSYKPKKHGFFSTHHAYFRGSRWLHFNSRRVKAQPYFTDFIDNSYYSADWTLHHASLSWFKHGLDDRKLGDRAHLFNHFPELVRRFDRNLAYFRMKDRNMYTYSKAPAWRRRY